MSLLIKNHLYALALTLILVVSALVYSPVYQAGFLITHDDGEQIVMNDRLADLSPAGLIRIFRGISLGMYQPLATLSYAIEYQIVALDQVWVYHNTNLVLHLINILLVAWLTRLLWRRDQVAVLSAVLFALWPTQVEPVVWLSCRSTLLASALMLGALIAYLKMVTSAYFWRYYPVVIICALLAMLSKSSAVALVPLLVGISYYYHFWNKRFLVVIAPVTILALITGVISILARRVMYLEGPPAEFGILNIIILSSSAFAWQLLIMVMPWSLSPTYPRLADVLQKMPLMLYFSALSPLLVLLLAWLKRRNRHLVGASIWLLSNLIFSISIVPYTYQAGSDRYNYLAVLALIWPLSFLIMRQWRFHYWVKLVALIFILSCSYVNYVYAQAWQSDLKLWNYAVIQSPGSAPVWNNLAIARMNAGDAIGALMAIETGLSFEWGRYEFIINRGYLKLVLARGRQDILMEAKADLVLAESKLPNNATAKYYLGLCEFQLGQLTESLTHFQEALSLAKSIFFEAEINFQKGEVYAKLGERVLACQSWTLASTHHQVARERLNDCQVK